MSAPSLATGVILCRIGLHRVAFAAQEVTNVDAPDRSGHRQLWCSAGAGVSVSELEIHSGLGLSVLPLPALMHRLGARGLVGFVPVHNQIWPLFRLSDFARLLDGGVR